MSISIDVDIDDILYGMNRWDRRQFFQAMQEDGYISKSCVITNEGEIKASPHIEQRVIAESKDEFNQALRKLFGNGWRLTLEQEQYIIELAKRF
jgi:hypothetical protein